VKTTNLRNKPVDRRRLSAEDRASYKPSNRVKAVSKARARKGQLAWNNKVNMGRQEQSPGTGGFTQGISLQQARLREEGAKIKRAEALRPQSP
jgi:hypothetical protein